MKKIVLLLFIATVIIISGCTSKTLAEQTNKSNLTIGATFYPFYQITKDIAADKAEVVSLVPNGVEPHDYDPTPGDLVKFSNAKGFVTIGLEFGQIETKLLTAVNDISVIDSKKDIVLINNSGGKPDPHIWLSPKNMEQVAKNIADGLKKADPKNTLEYDKNTQLEIQKQNQLDQEYSQGLANCKNRIILTSHSAFAYLANDYNFTQIGISGLEPDTEPTPGQLKELVDTAKKYKIKYIFYEELVDPKISNVIANEVGAQTMQLNPIEGTKNVSDNYFTIMRRNLANLRLAMECE